MKNPTTLGIYYEINFSSLKGCVVKKCIMLWWCIGKNTRCIGNYISKI